MASNSPRNAAAKTHSSPLGPALGSGVRSSRKNAVSPPSGVHTRPERQPAYAPPRPDFDAPQPTLVKAPDATLLKMTRGEVRAAHGARLGWFLFGALAGAAAVWSVTRDVPSDVFRARLWAASELRALHGRYVASDATFSSAPAPAPGSIPSNPPIPVVDVERLPRVPPAPVTPPAAAPNAPGAPALAHAPGPR
jgi:hypothetical protein